MITFAVVLMAYKLRKHSKAVNNGSVWMKLQIRWSADRVVGQAVLLADQLGEALLEAREEAQVEAALQEAVLAEVLLEGLEVAQALEALQEVVLVVDPLEGRAGALRSSHQDKTRGEQVVVQLEEAQEEDLLEVPEQ
jgi:hypothetical protein